MANQTSEETKKSNKTVTKTSTVKKTPAKKTPTKSTAAKKTPTKATTTKSTTAKKATTKGSTAKKPTTKATSAKSTTKKSTPAKTTKPVDSKLKTTSTNGFTINRGNEHDNLLDILSTAKPEPKKSSKKDSSKKEPQKKDTKKVVQTRTPHKPRTFNKEEKALYKKLEESFNYVANLTMVIEERTMDPSAITDLTIGELHVLEVVNQASSMPMTKVANQLKITVGSLTTCVNRLVKKEYLFRERDAVDHRIIKVSTTPKAKKALKSHDQFHSDILLGVLDGVTIRDATKVMAQFERTLENYINPKEKNYDKPIDTKKKKTI